MTHVREVKAGGFVVFTSQPSLYGQLQASESSCLKQTHNHTAVVWDTAHVFNPNTPQAETGRSL